jgi:hypothetical protein
MAIQSSSIASESVLTNNLVTIEMLAERPTPGALVGQQRPSGQICGYYDNAKNYVELYIVAAGGFSFLRVG